uniref:Uncharacterized protein n=1 Tax=Parascaris univalens TaxID=6257 RepID=A0A915AV46_PARUN
MRRSLVSLFVLPPPIGKLPSSPPSDQPQTSHAKKNITHYICFFRYPSLFNNSYKSALSNSTFDEEANYLELSDAKDVEKSGTYSAPFEISLEMASHARKELQLVRMNLSALFHSLFLLYAHFYLHPRHVRHLPAFAKLFLMKNRSQVLCEDMYERQDQTKK